MNITSKLEQLSISHFTNEPLAKHTWYKIGGNAKIFALPQNEAEIQELVSACVETGLEYYILGDGANVLFSDEGFDGVVISTSGLNQISITAPKQVTAQAGAKLQDFIDFCIASELDGYAKLSGIPGTIGGNIKMNAGAFGQEISDHLTTVTVLENDKVIQWPKKKLGFSYRKSEISASQIVLGATFQLAKGDSEEMKQIKDQTIAQRESKQPSEYPSCGSVFKKAPLQNLETLKNKLDIDTNKFIAYGGIPAGILIEAVGLKGANRGGAQFSQKHANFIINTGQATASDVLYLMNKAREEVFAKTALILEPEVQLIGLSLDKLPTPKA